MDISEIVTRSNEVGLKLNPLKTQFIIIGSSANLKLVKENDSPQIIVDNKTIAPFPSVKSLGVIISEDIAWNEHINL